MIDLAEDGLAHLGVRGVLLLIVLVLVVFWFAICAYSSQKWSYRAAKECRRMRKAIEARFPSEDDE